MIHTPSRSWAVEQQPFVRSFSRDDGVHLSGDIDVTDVFGLISTHGGERLRVFGLQHGVRMLLKVGWGSGCEWNAKCENVCVRGGGGEREREREHGASSTCVPTHLSVGISKANPYSCTRSAGFCFLLCPASIPTGPGSVPGGQQRGFPTATAAHLGARSEEQEGMHGSLFCCGRFRHKQLID